MNQIIVKEINCKSILNTSKLADYCINPYVGCQHACKYCYADSITRRFSNHSEPWGNFVDVKINAPDVLRKEILKKKKGSVFISSLTDAYQPLEKKYELTRKILEILLKYQFPVTIQTKSSLILRDLDLLLKFKDCEVGFTITTLDESVKKNFEPYSSSVKEKLDALRILKENKINTYIFVGPILPHLTDRSLEEIIRIASELKIDYLWFDKLNLKVNTRDNIQKIVKDSYPQLTAVWEKIFFSKNDYYKNLKEMIIQLCEKNNVNYKFCY